MAYNRGERMRLQNALTPRERRRMMRELSNVQEEMELLEEKRDKLAAEYWLKGVSITAIQGSLGLGYNTVRSVLSAQGLDIDPE